MAADFPTSIATLATISPTDEMDDPGVEGDVVINRITEELVAVQTQVGVTGSAVVGTVEKRLTDVISTAATALAQSGVTSVAGQTGAVTLGVADVSGAAPLNSPGLTGTPTAPTAIPGTNTTQVATTAFVADAAATAVATAPGLITSVAGRTGAITLAVGDVTNAVATNDSRLSDSRTPTSHKISHATGGGDALTPSDIGAVATNDSRLTDARTPTAHKASHVTGGSDALSASDIGAAPLNSPGLTGTPTAPTAAPGTNTTQVATTAFVATAVSGATAAVTSVAGRTGAVTLAVGDVSNAVATNDSRLTDSRTPTSHKASHAIGGSDVLAASDIGAAALNSPGFTGTPTAPTAAGGTNTTQIATTAFVQSAVSGVSFPVTSVAGRTGAITLAVGDVTNAVATNDSRLTDARTPTSHKTSHATGGGDALTASDIGAVATNGLAGGQTLIGGTQPSENLTLQSTAHATRGKVLIGSGAAYDEVNVRLGVGTQSPSSKIHVIGTTEQERLGYDASNYYATTVSSAGVVTHDATGGQHIWKAINSAATLGSELVTNGTFPSDLSSWTDSGSSWSWSSGAALHTPGSASTLSQNLSISTGATYLVSFSISGRTAGSISIAIGSVSIVVYGTTTTFTGGASRSLVAADNGTVALVITPTSDFDGKVDDVSVKALTLGSVTPTLVVNDSTNTAAHELRASLSASESLGIGKQALRSLADKSLSAVAYGVRAMYSSVYVSSVVGIGNYSLYSARDSQSTVAVGVQAAYSATYPYASTYVGYRAGYYGTTAGNQTLIGSAAGSANVTSHNMVAVGTNAATNLTTSGSTTAIGANAVRYIADGSTAATSSAAGLYLGADVKASANGVVNENVLGYNAIGIGSNSFVLGSSAITKCQIYGDLILDKTITAAGTTGAQTINKTCGSVNFAAAATSLVVTNSRVTTSSVIVATVATNDSTMKTVLAVPASGSFTLYANAAATAETRVNWIVIN